MNTKTKPSLLLTGASGFLGQVLYPNLKDTFDTTRLGRSPNNEIIADLVELEPELPQAYDYLVHAAGWAHRLAQTKAEARTFWQINHQGTENLLAALNLHPPKAMILISTVSVYGRSKGEHLTENTSLAGDTPYAASKLAAERDFRAWAQSKNIPFLVLRLPLVIGPNPPGNLGAIQRAIRAGYYIMISDNEARKSVVRADDVALFIADWLCRAEKTSGTYHLTDGLDPGFNEIVKAIAEAEQKEIRFTLSESKLRMIARLGDAASRFGLPAPLRSDVIDKMTQTLTFSSEKAVEELGWESRAGIDFFSDEESGFRLQESG